MPEISILMPVHNAEKYLVFCLESVVRQTFEDWELIVVDDFSTDNSKIILRNFAEKNSRIKTYENKSKGIIPALALAFENSSGQYITRMDADDIMPPNKLEYLHKIVCQGENIVATGTVRYFSDNTLSDGYLRYQNWLNDVLATGEFEKNIYRECVVASPNWMVHRSCFEKNIQFRNLSYPEDYDLVFQWYKKGYEIIGTNTLTHLWREHGDRTSRNSEIYQQESFFRLKTKYFIQIELKSNNKIQLIGAGKKGKLVAQILRENSVEFDWFEYLTENEKSALGSVENLSSKCKTILTNWPFDISVQKEIGEFLYSKGMIFGKNIWLF